MTKPEIGAPDDAPPGVRRAFYGIFCWLNRHPRVLRGISSFVNAVPVLRRSNMFAFGSLAVLQVLSRPASFSNTSHATNLIAGEFLIGMDPGPIYSDDKALFQIRLQALDVKNDADQEAKSRIEKILSEHAGATTPFDLITDYLAWVVLRATAKAFGAAHEPVFAGSGQTQCNEQLEERYMLEIRYVATQLFAGDAAPVEFKRRAEVCADALRARIRNATLQLCIAWPETRTATYDTIRRNAIGLAWVSHPVTVQSAALAFEELLGRPEIYSQLRSQAKRAKPDVWQDDDFRSQVRLHVLELMRFRPIFPFLARHVPRDTEFENGGRRNSVCPAGTKVTVVSISAMFSDEVPASSAFCPARDWGEHDGMRYLMFGYGDRQCPAKNHALDMITSAFIGLLTLPELELASGKKPAIQYEGPLMSRMLLRAKFSQPRGQR